MKKYHFKFLLSFALGFGLALNARAQDDSVIEEMNEDAEGHAQCEDILTSFNSGADKIKKRINTLLSRIFEINSLDELTEVHGEVEGYYYTWAQKVDVLGRTGVVSAQESEVTLLIAQAQKLFSALVSETSKPGEEFSVLYIKTILLNADPSMSYENDFKLLVEGVKARSSVNFEKLKKLASIAARLQKDLWIPASIRAKLALLIWQKKQEVGPDILAYLPFIFKNMPTNATRSKLLYGYLKANFDGRFYNVSPYATVYSDILVTFDGLTKEKVAQFLSLASEFSKSNGMSIPMIKVASAVIQGKFDRDEFFSTLRLFSQKIGYKKYTQIVDFTYSYMLKRQPGQDPETMIKFVRVLGQNLDSAVARKIALHCLEHDRLGQNPDDYIRIARDLSNSNLVPYKQVGAFMGPIIAKGAGPEIVQRYKDIVMTLRPMVSNNYIRSHSAALAEAVMTKNLSDTQIADIQNVYAILSHANGVFYYNSIIVLTKAAMDLGLTSDLAERLRDAFNSMRAEGWSYQTAAKFAVAIVKAETKNATP